MEFKKEFDKLKELGESTFVIRGSTIIAEMLPEPEYKTASGLIVATPGDHLRGSLKDNKLEAAVVLATGPGYYNEETGGYEPLDVAPGAVIVLPQYSVQVISTFPGIQRPTNNKVVLVKFDSVLCFYPSEEAYKKATECLKEA